MLILAIESSCDETAAAILEGDIVHADVVASQAIHTKYGGVVPELASRQHVISIDSVVQEALAVAGCRLDDIGLVAATYAPGLVGGLLVGVQAAKGISFARGLPFLGVHHLEGHLTAAHLGEDPPPYPHVALVVSGGHSQIILVRDFGNYALLGGTRDDAAGEAFDKVAKLLGLGYPGGRAIDERAKLGDASAFPFTPIMPDKGLDFSFSGLKTAVRTKVHDLGALDDEMVTDMCASFQRTVVEVLVRKTVLAAKEAGVGAVQICGGVAANSELRESMRAAGEENGFSVHVAAMRLCTDNGAMIGAAANRRFALGQTHGFDLVPTANLPLTAL